MRCPNNEELCFCEHPLDGTFINSWLPERLRNYKLQSGEDREAMVRALEDIANGAYSMWRNTL